MPQTRYYALPGLVLLSKLYWHFSKKHVGQLLILLKYCSLTRQMKIVTYTLDN